MITVNNREEYLQEVLKLIGTNCSAVELGVLNGDFSQVILDILMPKTLVLVDPFEVGKQKYDDGLPTAYSTEEDYQNLVKRFSSNDKVFIVREYSYNAVVGCFNGCYDFIYIDACHLYECVKKDLNFYRSKLSDNGIIGLHDYAEMYGFGVVQAVDEFCIEHGFEKIIYNSNGHDVALKKK